MAAGSPVCLGQDRAGWSGLWWLQWRWRDVVRLRHNLGVQPVGLADGLQAPHELRMAARSEPCSHGCWCHFRDG